MVQNNQFSNFAMGLIMDHDITFTCGDFVYYTGEYVNGSTTGAVKYMRGPSSTGFPKIIKQTHEEVVWLKL